MLEHRALLTVAGTDPTSGAGVTADLQVFRDFEFHGLWVATTLLDQDTRTVHAVRSRPAAHVAAELERVSTIGRPAAIKIGVLGDAAVARAVARCLAGVEVPVVLDPVLASGYGAPLGGDALCEAIRTELLEVVGVVTPNVPEVEALTGRPVTSLDAAAEVAAEWTAGRGFAVMVKGGHLAGAPGDVWAESGRAEVLPNAPGPTYDVHGTGCHLSSALAALLAEGVPGLAAAQGARRYLRGCLAGLGRLADEGPEGRAFIVHGPRTERAAREARAEIRA